MIFTQEFHKLYQNKNQLNEEFIKKVINKKKQFIKPNLQNLDEYFVNMHINVPTYMNRRFIVTGADWVKIPCSKVVGRCDEYGDEVLIMFENTQIQLCRIEIYEGSSEEINLFIVYSFLT